MQSFFSIVILFLAAGSIAKPCGRRKLNSTSSLSTPAAGSSTPVSLPPTSSTSSTSVQVPSPSTSPSAGALGGGLNNLGTEGSTSAAAASPSSGSTPASGPSPDGFCNVVFNTGVGSLPGWPSTIWDSLTSNGVSSFIAFSLAPLSSTPAYASGPLPDAMQAAQIPICMHPDMVNDTMTAMTSSSPPAYMEVFNEPDFSWHGLTPLTSPEEAGAAIQPLMGIKSTTKMVSPAVAITSSDWMARFRDACDGCMDKIDIVAAHIYDKDPAGALYQIKTLHNAWPDKRLWLTEFAPASAVEQGCTLDEAGMVDWMNTIIPQVKALGYVDKIFWNHGEAQVLDGGQPGVCDPSLTTQDGSATPLLQAYGKLCA